MSEGPAQGPEMTQPTAPKSPDKSPIAPSTETPNNEPRIETASGKEAKPAPEITQVPEEIRTRLVELLQRGSLDPEEKKELSFLLTAGKASLIEKNVEIDETTKIKLKELAEIFGDQYNRVELARGRSMGPFWFSLAKSEAEIGKDLTQILPDSKEQTSFWNNVVRVLEEAKKGINNRGYQANLNMIYGSFSDRDPLDETSELIREQARNFVEEAKKKDINETFITAREELSELGSHVVGSEARLLLMPASLNVLKNSLDTDIVTTPEGKMAWVFVARCMTQYMNDHFSKKFQTPPKGKN